MYKRVGSSKIRAESVDRRWASWEGKTVRCKWPCKMTWGSRLSSSGVFDNLSIHTLNKLYKTDKLLRKKDYFHNWVKLHHWETDLFDISIFQSSWWYKRQKLVWCTNLSISSFEAHKLGEGYLEILVDWRLEEKGKSCHEYSTICK